MTQTESIQNKVLDNIEAAILAAFAAVGWVLFFYEGVDVSLGVRVFYVGVVAGSIIAYPAARRLVDYLYTIPTCFIVSLDATQADYDFSVHELTTDAFNDVTIKGEDYDLEPVNAGAPVYLAESFNPSTMQAAGIWTASISSREMLVNRGKFREVRDELEEDAKKVYTLRSKISSVVRQTFEEVMLESLRVNEKEAVFHGESIDRIINEKLDVETDELDTMSHSPEQSAEPMDETGQGEDDE